MPADENTATTLIAFDALIQRLDQLLDDLLVDDSLNQTTFQALNVIEDAGRRGLRQCVLAETLQLPAATISRLVDTLVKNDLIGRSAHPTDRRVTMLTLTTAGEKRLARRRADYRSLAKALPLEAAEAMRSVAPQLDFVIRALTPAPSGESTCDRTPKRLQATTIPRVNSD
ncbi:MarR family winged helix-turn-helix transcriptional regulator [Brevundimonas sp. SL130]|uniref:MarR family winged helix-turn-helix transcriptional regulator n=1 Tax=Brevundimonas sp. SL130 TaxID=2995143 RepID=UPI00226CF579|nr:MarR family transcriptional regulator [Brevundimonas sp. SL130]WAC59603.1 MarR family transcriptional regulator [Brevundimonas sp. SL130]